MSHAIPKIPSITLASCQEGYLRMFCLTSSKNPRPLKFKRHNFGVRCYNTLHCQVLYNNDHFTRFYEFEASGEPERPD